MQHLYQFVYKIADTKYVYYFDIHTYSKTANEICITGVFGDIPIIKLIYKHDWLEFYVTWSVARDVAR